MVMNIVDDLPQIVKNAIEIPSDKLPAGEEEETETLTNESSRDQVPQGEAAETFAIEPSRGRFPSAEDPEQNVTFV